MVKVTKKVPKTVYVDVVTEEPQESTVMVPETRTRKIKVPYQKEIVDQQIRKITETIPVTKYRTEYDTVSKTVYEDSWQTKLVPVTKIVRKEIPVYQVVPTGDCGNCNQVDAGPAGQAVAENAAELQQEAKDSEPNADANVPQPAATQYQNSNMNMAVETSGMMHHPDSARQMQPVPAVGNPDQGQVAYTSNHQMMAPASNHQMMAPASNHQMMAPASNHQMMAPASNHQMMAPSQPNYSNHQMMAPAQTNYPDGAQWMNQATPMANGYAPNMDGTQMVPQPYGNNNDPRR